MLIVLNVTINGFIKINVTNHELLDGNLNMQTFQIIIAICQLAGSVLCLILVDFVERKVSIQLN